MVYADDRIDDNAPLKLAYEASPENSSAGSRSPALFQIVFLAAQQLCFGFFQEVVLVGFKLAVNRQFKRWFVIT